MLIDRQYLKKCIHGGVAHRVFPAESSCAPRGLCSLGEGALGATRPRYSSLVVLALATPFCTAVSLKDEI